MTDSVDQVEPVANLDNVAAVEAGILSVEEAIWAAENRGRKEGIEQERERFRGLLDGEAADLLGVCGETDRGHRADQFEYRPDETGTGGSYWCCMDCWKKVANRPLIDAVTEIDKLRRGLDQLDAGEEELEEGQCPDCTGTVCEDGDVCGGVDGDRGE